MEAADRVAAGDYEARVQERGPREVRRLGRSFNEMAERLGTNELRRRQLLADVAHELRTPLSVIQANLEALLDGLYPIDEAHLRRVLEETATMSRLLTDLQTLSTAEAGALALHREPTAPRDLVDAAVASFATQASDASVRLVGRVADDLRSSRSIGSGSARSSRTSSRTRSVTRRRAVRSSSPRGRSTTAWSSRSPTPGAASTRNACRTCSTGSPARPSRPAPASASRSRGRWWRRTAARSAPTAVRRARRSRSSFPDDPATV